MHRHSTDVHVKLLSGSMFIIIGERWSRPVSSALSRGVALLFLRTPGMTSGGTRKRC